MVRTELQRLIDNREAIDAQLSVAEVGDLFRLHPHEHMAVCEAGVVAGVCSRSQVLGLLGGRYGFALHSRTPIGRHLLPECLIFEAGQPVRALLESALSRGGDAFYHDVVVVDGHGRYAGMISTQNLVVAQSALVRSQFNLVESQRQDLEQANAELSLSVVQQRALERQVIQKEKAALVETLAGGIAHEINNKLVPIVGYAELIIDEIGTANPETLTRYCRTMLEGALESSHIIGQLLQLSRPPRAEFEVWDLATIVRQSLTLVKLRLKEAGTTLVLELPDEPVFVRADGAQIKQVLMNLVLNGIDAMEQAPSARLAIRLQVGETARVTVEDCGSGIAPDHLPRIFDPFFTTKAPNRGTGLGLGVCAAIVKQHGSEIIVDSIVGRGSVFSFELPIAADPPTAGATASPGSTASRAASRALVVDDDEAVATLVAETLRRRFGYEVERAGDGEQARRKLLMHDYDIVLCDVRMPTMNGLELVAWIRNHRISVLPAMVLMTGDAGTALTEHIDAAGVPVLRKPFTFEALSALVRQFGSAAGATFGDRAAREVRLPCP